MQYMRNFSCMSMHELHLDLIENKILLLPLKSQGRIPEMHASVLYVSARNIK